VELFKKQPTLVASPEIYTEAQKHWRRLQRWPPLIITIFFDSKGSVASL
jgi:hypothetical protein